MALKNIINIPINCDRKIETIFGHGTVKGIEIFASEHDGYRLGIKHDIFPKHLTKSSFKDEILYMFHKDILSEKETNA